MSNRSDKIFDAIWEVAVQEAFQQEMESLPSSEEMNSIYKPSYNLDKKIKKIVYTQQLKSKFIHFAKTSRRVVAIVAIIFTALTTVLLSVEASRNYILNPIIKWHKDHTTVQFGDVNEVDEEYETLVFEYIPSGYDKVQAKLTGDIYIKVYQNSEGKIIVFEQNLAQSSVASVDNEDKTYTEIKINNSTAYLFDAIIEEDMNILIWQFEEHVFKLSSKLDSEELIRMAESTKKK